MSLNGSYLGGREGASVNGPSLGGREHPVQTCSQCVSDKCLCVFLALLSVTAVNYLLSVVALVMFYVYYTHSDGCTENKVFISINMLLCIAASLLSILPQIQVHTHSSRPPSDYSHAPGSVQQQAVRQTSSLIQLKMLRGRNEVKPDANREETM